MSAVLEAVPSRPVAPAPNCSAIPQELTQRKQWVLWVYALDDGRWTKRPKRASGSAASSTDPNTWTTFANAQRVYLTQPGKFDGIGFVTSADDTTILIDLDHVIDTATGEIAAWAQPIREAAEREGAYLEVSVSGTGFHIIGHGDQFADGTKRNDAELYCSKRFFTISGQGVTRDPAVPLGTLVDTVALVRARINPPKGTQKDTRTTTNSTASGSDDDLLSRARRAANGGKFQRLYDAGDVSGYDSASEADLALASLIAFWTGPNAEAVERLMRRSALVRDKWDERRGESSYLTDTIQRALTERTEYYRPGARNDAVMSGGHAQHLPGDVTSLAALGVVNTDMVNARRLALRSGQRLRYTPEAGWLAWDGRRWRVDDLGEIQALAKDAAVSIFDEIKDSRFQKELFDWARKSQSVNRIQAMIELAKSEAGIPARLTDFDTDPMRLTVANGTLDLSTGHLLPHSQDDRITRVSDIPWQPEARCDLWASFLRTVLRADPALLDYIQRAVGYTLTGRTDEQCLFFLYGTGANGKSVFEETVGALLGEYGTTTRTETIMQRGSGGIPNDIAALRGARYVCINETADGQRINEPLVKDMTGGDTMSARFMRQEFFTFRPQFKLWIRGNHKPVITGTDYGIWRRIHLVPFTFTIPEGERDPALFDKLRLELPGILRWAVEGCLAWQHEGLNPPRCVTEAVREYRREMDVLGAFIEDRCMVRDKGEVSAKAIYRAYRDWCDGSGESPVNQRRFGIALQERGIRKDHSRAGTVYYGIELHLPGDGFGPGIEY